METFIETDQYKIYCSLVIQFRGKVCKQVLDGHLMLVWPSHTPCPHNPLKIGFRYLDMHLLGQLEALEAHTIWDMEALFPTL